MREVDEAVRQDEVGDFMKKYGRGLIAAVVLGFGAFGGYLFWQSRSEAALEGQSEALVQAMDELNAGNTDGADSELAAMADGEAGAAVMARMLRAGIAVQAGRTDEAVTAYDAIAADGDLPQALRDIATLRSVAAQYDNLDPQEVIDRVGPLAVPDNAYYGTAGEIVAHAYIDQGKNDEAGALLGDMSRNEDVPQSIRGRARQLAGLLGFDAIEDVDATLAEITGDAAPSAQLVQ